MLSRPSERRALTHCVLTGLLLKTRLCTPLLSAPPLHCNLHHLPLAHCPATCFTNLQLPSLLEIAQLASRHHRPIIPRKAFCNAPPTSSSRTAEASIKCGGFWSMARSFSAGRGFWRCRKGEDCLEEYEAKRGTWSPHLKGIGKPLGSDMPESFISNFSLSSVLLSAHS